MEWFQKASFDNLGSALVPRTNGSGQARVLPPTTEGLLPVSDFQGSTLHVRPPLAILRLGDNIGR